MTDAELMDAFFGRLELGHEFQVEFKRRMGWDPDDEDDIDDLRDTVAEMRRFVKAVYGSEIAWTVEYQGAADALEKLVAAGILQRQNGHD